MRTAPRAVAATAALIALLALTALRCGRDDDKDKKKVVPGTPPGTAVPADWNGASDWSGSQWEVIEE